MDRARYVGEAIALVAVERRYDLEDALDSVEIEYDPLEVVVDPDEATKKESALVYDEWGSNVFHSAAFSKEGEGTKRNDSKTLSCTFRIPRVAGAPIEVRGIIASYDKRSERLSVWAPVQRPHVLRSRASPLARPARE